MSTSAAYDGGAGGKFRKRPLRRAATTPYDRPPTHPRAAAAAAAAGGGGWISKLVDPASRLIAGGASRIFSSFFSKRLPAPPEESNQSRQDLKVATIRNPSPQLTGQGGSGQGIPTKNPDTVCELEELLKKKTFTRIEFEHLTELLRSRTVEPVVLEPAVDNKTKENGTPSSRENPVRESGLNENLSTPAGSLTILKDVVASPTEVARTYMSSRPSKVSPSLRLSSPTFQEDANFPSIVPYVSRSSNLSVTPRSVTRFSGTPRFPENGFQTPKSRGRSAMYRMSSSPYFKVQSKTTIKGHGVLQDGYSGPSSHLTSVGKQVLKRGSSVLDNDSGSFGPIRRIRQRSSLMYPSQDNRSTQLVSAIEGSSSVHKPSHLNELKYHSTTLHGSENKGNINYLKVASVPPKSSETAMKILQHLDKLTPSPKAKSSQGKAVAIDTSPSELAPTDSTISLNVERSGFQSNVNSLPPSPKNPLSMKQYGLEENGVLKVSSTSAAIPTIDAKSGSIASILSSKANPGFQVDPPKDLSGPDNFSFNAEGGSGSLSAKVDKIGSKQSTQNSVISETATLENSTISLLKKMPNSNVVPSQEVDMKASASPITKKDSGFVFSSLPSSSPRSHSPPIMPTPSLGTTSPPKEQSAVPFFSFASKAAQTVTSSLATTIVSDSSSQKHHASDAATSVAGGDSEKEKDVGIQMAGNLPRTPDNAFSLGLPSASVAGVFGFGSSSIPKQCNGLLQLSSPASASPVVIPFDSQTSSTSPRSIFTSNSMGTSIPDSVSDGLKESNSKNVEVKPELPGVRTDSSPVSFVSKIPESGSSTVTTSAGSSSAVALSSMVLNAGFSFSSQLNTSSCNSQSSTPSFGATAGSIFGTQLTSSGSGISGIPQSATCQIGSMTSTPTFGLNNPSSGFGRSVFPSPSVIKPFTTSSLFSTASESSTPGTSSFTSPSSATSLFGSTPQPSTSSVFCFSSTTNTSQFTGFSSGLPTTATVSSSKPFNSPNGPLFSFTSSSSGTTSAASPALPTFGTPSVSSGFIFGSPGNDQMNVECSMNGNRNQATTPTVPTFGRPTDSPAAQSPVFGSNPSGGSSVFQFGSNPSPSIPQTTPQAGSTEFPPSGSFNVGSGGGDKSGRRIIKVKRDKLRKR